MRWLPLACVLVTGCAGGSAELDDPGGDASVRADTTGSETTGDAPAEARSDGGADATTDSTADTRPDAPDTTATDSALDTTAADTASADSADTAPADTGTCDATSPCGGGLACCGGKCVDVKTSVDHCGKCGDKCTVINGTGKCVDGACSVGACNAGWGDCDGDGKSCEASTTIELLNCGGCGIKCTLSDATSACVDGKCAIASCAPGYGDCDKLPENGCEVDLATDPANCGACGAKPTEICNGVDDDCDGTIDEGFDCKLGTPASSCTTTCGTTGTKSCTSTCAFSACMPPAETCNVADDDCNGKCDDLAGCRVGVHRNYKSSTGEHFYTTSLGEGPGAGFTLEFSNYYYLYSAAQPGLVPFYRCWVAGVGMHFYTQSSTCEGQTVEGSMGWIATTAVCGATPLYRLVHKTNGDHFYTTSDAERASALSGAYLDEGIAGYVWTASSG